MKGGGPGIQFRPTFQGDEGPEAESQPPPNFESGPTISQARPNGSDPWHSFVWGVTVPMQGPSAEHPSPALDTSTASNPLGTEQVL